MTVNIRRWSIPQTDKARAAELAESCELHPFLSLLLTAQGVTEPEDVLAYLAGQEEEIDPFSFADMERAAERVRAAIDRHERIFVYGDYDVDGITATVLLYSYLRDAGADVIYRVPSRDLGYGLHEADVRFASTQGVQLILTVDTGICAVAEVRLASELGMDVVVTDHHQPPEELPAAVAVVDPHRRDCESTAKDLAGVGVAFMLVCAIEGDGEKIFRDYGDLLTLGTLADAMPLCGFNRDLMRRGLLLLEESTRPGLFALRQVAGCTQTGLTATNVVFLLVPRLNAAGRMDDPDLAARLLLTGDEEEAQQLAEQLQQCNVRRQTVSETILGQVDDRLTQNPDWLYDRVLVVDGTGWHDGILGIVAARLSDRYGKPAIVLSAGEEGIAHGSGRSLPGFSLYDALSACSEWLTAFGGHEQAAGMSLPTGSVNAFRRAINDYAAAVCPDMPQAELAAALRLRPEQIDLEKLALLDALEPFGHGNPKPCFGLFHMTLDNIAAMGNGKHIRLSLSRNGCRINAVRFQTAPEEFPIACGSTVNCIVSLERNDFRGVTSVSIRVRDIGYDGTDREKLMEDIRTFEGVMRRELHPAPEQALPSRTLLRYTYALLHRCEEWAGTPEQLVYAVYTAAHGELEMPSLLPLLVALKLWEQVGLLSVRDGGERLYLRLLPADGKADLTQTPLWRYLEGGQ